MDVCPKRIYAETWEGVMSTIRLDNQYVHADDLFLTECASGLDGIGIYGISIRAQQERHLNDIRSNIRHRKEQEANNQNWTD